MTAHKHSSVLRVLLPVLALLVLAVILTVPFVYESVTMWYKVGADRVMLRLGKMAGLCAAYLLYIQVLLGMRGPFFTKIFGVPLLMRMHRVNGNLLVLLAMLHIGLVLLPEGLTNLPIGWKYWPEIVGALLFLILLQQSVFASLRVRLQLQYVRWRTFHKIFGYLILCVVPIHVLWVSDSFSRGVPRFGFLVLFGLFLLASGWEKLGPQQLKK